MRTGGLGVPWPTTPEQGARWATGVVALGALVLGALQGGYAPSRWGPFGILVLWLAVAAWLGLRRPRPSRAALVAIVASVLLTAWSALSITWASTPASALDATGRTALYACALALALLPRWPAASLRRLLVLVAAGATLLAVGTLAWVGLADDPTRWFIDGRLVAPTGYVNATAGLWGIALVPLVHLATGGLRSPGGRVFALAAAGLVLQASLLSQSRGAVLALAVAAVVLVVLSPHRAAILLAAVALGAVALVVSPALLDVRGAGDASALADHLHTAIGRVALGTLALTVLGTLWQLALRAMGEVRREVLTSRIVGVALTRALAVLLVVGFVVAVGNPVSWVGDKADQALHGGYGEVAPTGSRLTGALGSDRGDLYRVALHLFSSKPLTGVGAEDFQAPYLRERDSQESARFAHSLPLGVMAGLGIVGVLLLAAMLAAPTVAALGGLRTRGPDAAAGGDAGRDRSAAEAPDAGAVAAGRPSASTSAVDEPALDEPARAGAVAALAAFVAWLAGAAWDWIWEFPALTVLAFVLLAAAARATTTAGAAPSPELLAVRERARAHGLDVPDDRPAGPVRPPRGAARRGVAALVLLSLLLSAVFAALGASSYFLRKGTKEAATDLDASALSLARAARLNPLDSDSLLSLAVVVRRLGDTDGWRRDLERAIDRSPEDWFAHLELGMADVLAGDRAAALQNLRRAAALNPNQPTVREVLAAVERGQRVDPGTIEAQVAGRLATRLRSVGTSP